LARIHVQNCCCFLLVRSLLIPPRSVPGEACFTPRTLTRPEQATTSRRIPAHPTKSPQRQEPRSTRTLCGSASPRDTSSALSSRPPAHSAHSANSPLNLRALGLAGRRETSAAGAAYR